MVGRCAQNSNRGTCRSSEMKRKVYGTTAPIRSDVCIEYLQHRGQIGKRQNKVYVMVTARGVTARWGGGGHKNYKTKVIHNLALGVKTLQAAALDQGHKKCQAMPNTKHTSLLGQQSTDGLMELRDNTKTQCNWEHGTSTSTYRNHK